MSKEAPKSEPILVFAYGTLRPSLYPRAKENFNLTPRGEAVLYGNYELHHLGGFPGLIKVDPKVGERQHPDGGAAIKGEVSEVTSLTHLDRYEGYPSLYTREQVEVIMADGSTAHPWVYLYNGRPRQIIASGDWADAMKQDGRLQRAVAYFDSKVHDYFSSYGKLLELPKACRCGAIQASAPSPSIVPYCQLCLTHIHPVYVWYVKQELSHASLR